LTIARVLACYRIHGQNLWSNSGTDGHRLPARIEQRAAEVELMRHHAARRGVELPPENALDHEIAFINYRLMAKALHLDYPGSLADTRLSLLERAYSVLRKERYPLPLSLAHGLWFGALAVSPAVAAERLIRLRFQRGLRARAA
jgi:hypothetical protein